MWPSREGREQKRGGRRQEGRQGGIACHRGNAFAGPSEGGKKKAKRPSRFSPSRAVFFRRRAEVKQRLPSLSADAGVEYATRVTSREGGVIVLRAGARQKRGVKVVRGTRMQPPPQQREKEQGHGGVALAPFIFHNDGAPQAVERSQPVSCCSQRRENAPGATERACSREG